MSVSSWRRDKAPSPPEAAVLVVTFARRVFIHGVVVMGGERQ